MPHLQVVFAPSTPSLPFPPSSRVYRAQEDAKHARFTWCHFPVLTKSLCPFLSLLLSLALFLYHAYRQGHQAQLQKAPNTFTEKWGCLKGITHCRACGAVSLRPDRDTRCFSIYRKLNNFLPALPPPTSLQHVRDMLSNRSPISSFSLYRYSDKEYSDKEQGDLFWVRLLPELCLQLSKGANPTQETSSSKKTHNVKSKRFWFPLSATSRALSKSLF